MHEAQTTLYQFNHFSFAWGEGGGTKWVNVMCKGNHSKPLFAGLKDEHNNCKKGALCDLEN